MMFSHACSYTELTLLKLGSILHETNYSEVKSFFDCNNCVMCPLPWVKDLGESSDQ